MMVPPEPLGHDAVVTITARMAPTPTGQTAMSAPEIRYTSVPGGWATVHKMLVACLRVVGEEMVKEAVHNKPRVVVAQTLPDGNGLVR